jgi:glycosyltransferase involved in cell wall biosynthesis
MSDRLVTAVIPTRGRPELVLRAVRSALAQTYAATEVVVVVDGADEATTRALASLGDDRVKTVVLEEARGGADARNAGVSHARGGWIAFLDDDDEWLPTKITAQMAAVSRSSFRFPVVATALIGRSPHGDYVWPRRLPRHDEPIGDYLFKRRGLFQGEGVIQCSTILAPRELLLQVPFTSGLGNHQDWDWVLHASATPGVGFEFVPEPLAIWYIEQGRQSVSRTTQWQSSLEWIERNRHLVSPQAYSAFLMTSVGSRAARAGAWSAFLPLLAKSFRDGSPRPLDLALYLGMWAIPQRIRWRIRAALTGRQST